MSISFNLASSQASLRFPLDKVETSDDYLMFSVYKYQPPFRKAKCLDETGGSSWGGRYAEYDVTGLGGGDLSNSKYKKTIVYMPEDIRLNEKRNWSGKSVSPVNMAILRATGAGVDKGMSWDAASEAGKSFGNDAKSAWENRALVKLLASRAAGSAGIDENVATGGVLGQVVNPNLEVFFDKPELRSFNFGWTLVPRNERESRIIKEMIWQFKKASSPELNPGGWYLNVPHVYKIQYKTGSNENHWLNKIKACALTDIQVNYTAGGSWSTLEDGAPTAVGLTLSFQEIKTVISNDYGDSFQYTKQYY
tara:strand:+ start:13004 stop:13924 length:921 start_codon:yes stop_codon:yes gene_type:complete